MSVQETEIHHTDPHASSISLNPLGRNKENLYKDNTLFDVQHTHNHCSLHLSGYSEPQPHPEPIAWMVGTAIWWTKEEAERDAAETGLPIIGLGPMTPTTPAEQHQGEPVTLPERKPWNGLLATADNLRGEGWNACLHEIAMLGPLYTHPGQAAAGEDNSPADIDWNHVTELEAENYAMGAQLAERDTLLRDNSGKLIRMAAHLISAPLFALQDLQDEDKKMTRARVDKAVDTADARLKDAAYELRRIADALSASAGPSSPTWSCQACQVEQPTDRACDACGGKTELAGAQS